MAVSEAAGAPTATAAMAFTLDLAAGLTRQDVLKGLALIGQSIPEDQVAPA